MVGNGRRGRRDVGKGRSTSGWLFPPCAGAACRASRARDVWVDRAGPAPEHAVPAIRRRPRCSLPLGCAEAEPFRRCGDEPKCWAGRRRPVRASYFRGSATFLRTLR